MRSLIMPILMFVIFNMFYISHVQADEVWMQIGAFSKHGNSTNKRTGLKYNEVHNGIGFEYVKNNYFINLGNVSNSYNRDLTYLISGKQWSIYSVNKIKAALQLGIGAFRYGTVQRAVRIIDSSEQSIDLSTGAIVSGTPEVYFEDKTKKGFSPWLALSFSYKQIRIDFSYIPKFANKVIDENVITLQFKVKVY